MGIMIGGQEARRSLGRRKDIQFLLHIARQCPNTHRTDSLSVPVPVGEEARVVRFDLDFLLLGDWEVIDLRSGLMARREELLGAYPRTTG